MKGLCHCQIKNHEYYKSSTWNKVFGISSFQWSPRGRSTFRDSCRLSISFREGISSLFFNGLSGGNLCWGVVLHLRFCSFRNSTRALFLGLNSLLGSCNAATYLLIGLHFLGFLFGCHFNLEFTFLSVGRLQKVELVASSTLAIAISIYFLFLDTLLHFELLL